MKRSFWTEVEVEMLRRHYACARTVDLAQALGRTVERVLAKANALGLRKSTEVIAEIARERTARPDHATRIQPGSTPWNKGLKGVVGVQPECRATQFKPGSRPHTWVPIGSYRVTADGVFERKVNDEPGPTSRRWKPVSRLVWEEQFGPVPVGHLVVFKAGCRPARLDDLEAYTVERLECITRRQNMQRNSIHKYGPDIARLQKLRASLNRQINRAAEAAAQTPEEAHRG